MTHSPTGAGGLDWLEVWRRMYDEEREQAERVLPSDAAVQADCWVHQAQQFATASGRVEQPDSFMRFLLPRLRPSDTLLDIGAGTGRYEPTLARAVARVLALEPSPTMRAHLEQRLAAEQIGNVAVVAERWPEADLPPCDVAIAAHVVYGVREIGPFLQRMERVARRAAFVLLHMQHPAAFISAFWQRVYGESRLPLPSAVECFNVLHQLGIPAQFSLIPVPSRFAYADEHEALADVRRRLRLTDQIHDAALRDELDNVFARDSTGRLLLRNFQPFSAVVWWQNDESFDTARLV